MRNPQYGALLVYNLILKSDFHIMVGVQCVSLAGAPIQSVSFAQLISVIQPREGCKIAEDEYGPGRSFMGFEQER